VRPGLLRPRRAVADLTSYESFLSAHILPIPRVQRVVSTFTMKVIK